MSSLSVLSHPSLIKQKQWPNTKQKTLYYLYIKVKIYFCYSDFPQQLGPKREDWNQFTAAKDTGGWSLEAVLEKVEMLISKGFPDKHRESSNASDHRRGRASTERS